MPLSVASPMHFNVLKRNVYLKNNHFFLFVPGRYATHYSKTVCFTRFQQVHSRTQSFFFFLSCPNLLIGTIPVLGNLFFSFIYLYFNALLVFEECTHVIYYIYYLPKYFVTMMMIMQVLWSLIKQFDQIGLGNLQWGLILHSLKTLSVGNLYSDVRLCRLLHLCSLSVNYLFSILNH